MTGRSRVISFLVGFIVLGCALAARPPATTQTVTQPRNLKMDDAVPIARFRTEATEVDLRNQIKYQGQDDAIYFGQADTVDKDGEVAATQPLVVARIKGGWMALSMKDARLPNAEWQLVATGPASDEIWGVMDDVLNHQGKVILLAHSRDAGKTWTVWPVNKPFDSGDYDSFCMDKTGRGRLTVYIPPDEKHPRRGGFYHFRTTDGGTTWSTPEREPDALDPSDEVPEDEDPPPLRDSPLQSVRADVARSTVLIP